MSEYPRELILDEETEEELKRYLDTELLNHYGERSEYIDDLLRWQKDYWAEPTKERATFPFVGAATIVIPLSAIAVETIHARTMTTMFGQPQFVSAQAVASEWDQADKPFERFMDHELLKVMKIRDSVGDCFLEAEKFGTMQGKVQYEKVIRRSYREVAGVEQEFDVVIKDGAVVDAVAGSRFLMPYYAKDPQTSPWVGEEHTSSEYELQGYELGGLFREGTVINKAGYQEDINKQSKLYRYFTADSSVGSGQETGTKFDREQAKLESTTPSFPKTVTWHEVWLAFNVDKDPKGILKEIVVLYHQPSRTLLSVRYNWHSDLHRPYRIKQYFPVEHRWRGIGICKMNEQFQREITVQHRQRIDNATLANCRMFKVNKLTQYGNKEPIFPGKMWFVDDKDHIETLQMGEIYPSSYNNEQAALTFSYQRTAVNETVMGMPQQGTPGTATSDLARIQEGRLRFDFYYQNCRDFLDEIIVDTACVIQQFGPRTLRYFDTAENGNLVRAFFEMPDYAIRDGLILSMKASSQNSNRILDRQDNQQVASLMMQYYQGLMQLAMPLGNPQLSQLILTRGLSAATEAMRQILETYPNVRNVDRLIVKELEAQVQNAINGAPTTGNNTGVAISGQESPLALLAALTGGGGQTS